MRNSVIVGILGLLFLASCGDKAKQEPNIILVLADDLGVPQVGCYGSSYYKTPNIDRLALQGTKFVNAYAAAAVCSPTRAALYTGKNPSVMHITDFISGNPDSNHLLLQPDWQKFLPLGETTIAEILKSNGYKTALFGKWHLSKEKIPPVSIENNPDKQGFDETFITYKPSGNLPLGAWQTAENDAHNVDTLTSRAIDFIRRNRNAPFFLVLSHNAIHDPIMEKSNTIEKFRNLPNAGEEENNAVIAAMVERVDRNLGRLLETLQELNLEENTIIIFYSDNGAKESYAKQTPFRKGKGWLYEGGIRVPLIMKWKGVIKENNVCETPVTTMDFFPTLLAVSSSSWEGTAEGINLISAINKKGNVRERNLYWNYPHYHQGTGMKPACAIRSGDYKLIKWYEPYLLGQDSVFELYNLKDDVQESQNLAYRLPQKTKELDQLLEQWKSSIQAQEPSINLNYKPE